jgi:manganese transport protein
VNPAHTQPLASFSPADGKGTVIDGGSVNAKTASPFLRRLAQTAGPGLLVSVGYMDPGNWATDIAAGSQQGYALLWVVLLSCLAAMLLQTLSLRLGLASGKDLARACRDHYSPRVNRALWVLAEVAIVACDVAEVLGCALALHLLLNVSLRTGIAITALDTLIVLALQGKGFRRIEAIVLGLVLTIAACLAVELLLVPPEWHAVATGFVPNLNSLRQPGALYLAVGIVGATVMPHNLYLQSSIVQTRLTVPTFAGRSDAMRLATIDTVASLSLALLVNAAILVLAASAFHGQGQHDSVEIQDAYRLLYPLGGGAVASLLFGIALLAAGQSSTLTGTIAGQVVLEGFLNLKMAFWKRRLITRGLALVPAFAGISWLGDQSIGTLLLGSQVVLSLQLPFAVWPLIRLNSHAPTMGPHVLRPGTKLLAWWVFATITAANAWLAYTLLPT